MKALLIVLSVFIMNFSFAQQVESVAYNLVLKTLLDGDTPTISVEDAAGKDATFIDARSEGEYHVSHIQDAIWVGFENFDIKRLKDVNKAEPIVVYCSIGYRSEQITNKLKEAGFEQVFNLYGGIFEWVNQGNPVYRKQEKTPQIHAYSKSWGIWLNKGEKVY